jgi:hypothetical protein
MMWQRNVCGTEQKYWKIKHCTLSRLSLKESLILNNHKFQSNYLHERISMETTISSGHYIDFPHAVQDWADFPRAVQN